MSKKKLKELFNYIKMNKPTDGEIELLRSCSRGIFTGRKVNTEK